MLISTNGDDSQFLASHFGHGNKPTVKLSQNICKDYLKTHTHHVSKVRRALGGRPQF